MQSIQDYVNSIKTVDEYGNVKVDTSKIKCLLGPTTREVGRTPSISLFHETTVGGVDTRYKWLETTEGDFPCVETYYNAFEDPTEYLVGLTFAGNMDLWNKWCNTDKIKPYITALRQGLESKLRAEAFLTIQNLSKNNSKSSLIAAKYIIDKGWKKSVEDDPLWNKKEEARKTSKGSKFQDSAQVNDDFERLLGNNVVQLKVV